MSAPLNRRAAFGLFVAAPTAMAAFARETPVDAEGAEPDKIATAKELAALDFEPWRHAEGEWTPSSNEEWNRMSERLMPALRVAWLTMHKATAALK